MGLAKGVYSRFYRISKKFSRGGLYDWLDAQIETLRDQNISILNIGSGGEIYSRITTLKKAKITQVDIDPDRKPDIVADVCDLHMMADNSVDVVFMMEVLEHVKTPQEAVTELRRVLKPGGKLFLSTPFIFPIHDEPYDFYRYTKYGLAHLLRDYASVTIKERNDYVHSIMVLFARSIMVQGTKRLLAAMALFLFSLILYPALWIFSKLIDSPKSTTGYVTLAIK